MQGLMMDYQLNVPAILRRGDELYGDREIVSACPTRAGTATRTPTSRPARSASRRAARARALRRRPRRHADVEPPRVSRAYIGAPVGGFVTHTLNLRLHPDDNTYIASHAGDRVLVDKVLCRLLRSSSTGRVRARHAVGAGETPEGAIDYE